MEKKNYFPKKCSKVIIGTWLFNLFSEVAHRIALSVTFRRYFVVILSTVEPLEVELAGKDSFVKVSSLD